MKKINPLTLTRYQLLLALAAYVGHEKYQELCWEPTAKLRGLLTVYLCPDTEHVAPEKPKPPVRHTTSNITSANIEEMIATVTKNLVDFPVQFTGIDLALGESETVFGFPIVLDVTAPKDGFYFTEFRGVPVPKFDKELQARLRERMKGTRVQVHADNCGGRTCYGKKCPFAFGFLGFNRAACYEKTI